MIEKPSHLPKSDIGSFHSLNGYIATLCENHEQQAQYASRRMKHHCNKYKINNLWTAAKFHIEKYGVQAKLGNVYRPIDSVEYMRVIKACLVKYENDQLNEAASALYHVMRCHAAVANKATYLIGKGLQTKRRVFPLTVVWSTWKMFRDIAKEGVDNE
jgi:hypothetical protein